MMKKTMLAAVLACPSLCCAQAQTTTQIKKVPAPYTSPVSGEEMYKSYCAACHGADAKGMGPAAPALKMAPTDLTMLSSGNGGKFPSDKVRNVIIGDEVIASHGSRDMPVWGIVFRRMGSEGGVQQRTYNLLKYLESLQQK